MKVKSLKGRVYYWKPNLIDWEKESASHLQMDCKQVLAQYWLGDVVAEEQRMPATKLRFDFVNFTKKIIVEIQGKQHDVFNKFFHKKNVFNFVKAMKRDELKKEFATLNEFRFIEARSKSELHQIMLDL